MYVKLIWLNNLFIRRDTTYSVIYKIMAREPVLEFENRQELKAMMDGLKVQRERMIWIVFFTNK